MTIRTTRRPPLMTALMATLTLGCAGDDAASASDTTGGTTSSSSTSSSTSAASETTADTTDTSTTTADTTTGDSALQPADLVGRWVSEGCESLEGDFGFTTLVWTAKQQGAADLFNMAGCGAGGWEVDVPQDVGGTGCIGVAKPIAECPEEYDIVALDGDALDFGQRITDMCTLAGRPTALNNFPVMRQ